MDDFHDHLAGGDRTDHLSPDRTGAHFIGERLDDIEGGVGLDQGPAHFPQSRVHVSLGQAAAAGQLVEDAREAIAKCFEHKPFFLNRWPKRIARPRANFAGGRWPIPPPGALLKGTMCGSAVRRLERLRMKLRLSYRFGGIESNIGQPQASGLIRPKSHISGHARADDPLSQDERPRQ